MAEHDVWMKAEVGLNVASHRPVLFEVRSDDERLGTLRVSKRGVWWKPKASSKWRERTWEQFADWIG